MVGNFILDYHTPHLLSMETVSAKTADKTWFLRNKVKIIKTGCHNINLQGCYIIQMGCYTNWARGSMRTQKSIERVTAWEKKREMARCGYAMVIGPMERSSLPGQLWICVSVSIAHIAILTLVSLSLFKCWGNSRLLWTGFNLKTSPQGSTK